MARLRKMSERRLDSFLDQVYPEHRMVDEFLARYDAGEFRTECSTDIDS